MKNNKPKTDEKPTGSIHPVKSDYLKFEATFATFAGNKLTPEQVSEHIFGQSQVFVDSIFTAIHTLAFNIEGLGKNDSDKLSIVLSCASLALIGQAFAEEMHKQFYELQAIKEGKSDA